MKILLAAALVFLSVCSTGKGSSIEEKPVELSERSTLLAEGEPAPSFTLLADSGEKISLSQFRDKKNVVLYFYPKDNTPGCTKEAQSFRDDQERFKKAGAVVLGVSVDDIGSHKSFVKKQELNFPLLADVGGKVASQYGVMGWIMAKRVTYIIGKDGKIKRVFPEVDVSNHSRDVLKAVQNLGKS